MFVLKNPELIQVVSNHAPNIDHLAFAVQDLETSIDWYQNVLGFELRERRETKGDKTGMVSAVMRNGHGLDFVLLQGSSTEAQVSQFLSRYGEGSVHHVAIRVENLPELIEKLREEGIQFETRMIESVGMRQIFLSRDSKTGVMVELIERNENQKGFSDHGVQQLFLELERNLAF